ncbi:FadR family transcriptional regulator, partial [Thioclava sp. BHET1]
AAQHATEEEIHVLQQMARDDRELMGDPKMLSRANRRFHRQIQLASHNRFLAQQLDLVYRSMALLATTSFAAVGRDGTAMDEHDAIVAAIAARDGDAAYVALKRHISQAFETRLKIDAGEIQIR